MSNSSIWPIDRTLSGVTTGSNGNEGVLHILKISSITGASLSDCLASYLGHSLGMGGFYPSAEMQSMYSTASADQAVSSKRMSVSKYKQKINVFSRVIHNIIHLIIVVTFACKLYTLNATTISSQI